MKVKLVILFAIIYLAFLTPRLLDWYEENAPAGATPVPGQPHEPATPPPAASTALPSNGQLFNLGGEWRGKLQPTHGAHLDDRDWNLELRFHIRGKQAQVFIWRGDNVGWQEVKAGKFRIVQHKSNAIVYAIDSGNGWVESWVFSLSRRDEDSLYVYGNRIINNTNMAPADPRARITYGATAVFTRNYDRFSNQANTPSPGLSESEIAAQFREAAERARRLRGDKTHGEINILDHAIVKQADDTLTLGIKYRYDGLDEDSVFIGAMTMAGGKTTPHWRFRPAKVQRGENSARIEIGMNDTAPEHYCSDEIQVEVYEGGKSPFYRKTIELDKCWQKKN